MFCVLNTGPGHLRNIFKRGKAHKEMGNSQLEQKAKELRKLTLETIYKRGMGHIGGSFSIIEIIIALYEKILKKEDIFIFSKGHSWIPLYLILKEKGLNPLLSGHPERDQKNGIICTTGSLGHGLPQAIGIALGKKISNEQGRVFVLMSDGECQEGTTWESFMLAAQLKLKNLTIIIDRNGLQTLGNTEDILAIESLRKKIEAFNLNVSEINGHSFEEIIKEASLSADILKVIIAKTIKGKGVSFMEGISGWHTMIPDENQFKKAIEELS